MARAPRPRVVPDSVVREPPLVNFQKNADEGVRATQAYFLKRFSNAARASSGRAELGVEVSFSTRTRME